MLVRVKVAELMLILVFVSSTTLADKPRLLGLRVDNRDDVVTYETEGEIHVAPASPVKIQAFGLHLSSVEFVLITKASTCDKQSAASSIETLRSTYDGTKLTFNAHLKDVGSTYYVCLCYLGGQNVNDTNSSYECDQGRAAHLVLKSRYQEKVYYLPFVLQIIVVCCLLVLSGLFSGLNLGLMSLDKTELKIIQKVGDEREKQFARKIYPIRKSGNYLLCTLLLGNVVVNSGISILFDDLTSGYVALVFASLGIVIFGEIIPQAVCSRYGLAVGAYTVWITRFFMVLTFPLSWPISKLLDKVLGEEVGQVYNREHMLELIHLSKGDDNLRNCQEVQIVAGALELPKKTVGQVMTPLNTVYMLPSDMVLDPKTVSDIVKNGYTRIPVYNADNPNSIVHILNVKDLALLDPEDKIPLATICRFYQHPVEFVTEDIPLGAMLEEFKKGRYHLAIVQRLNTERDGDPTYDAVGLITLEDIIEEIIQAEIQDEFDVIRETRASKKRKTKFGGVSDQIGEEVAGGTDITLLFNKEDEDSSDVSPQLTVATYQYLSTTFDAFGSSLISQKVLHRLIRLNVRRLRASEGGASRFLYQKGKESDLFILILEGKCTVTVGESNLVFEAGPFHYFGQEILTRLYERERMLSTNSEHSKTEIDITPSSTVKTFFDMATSNRNATFVPDYSVQLDQVDLIYLKLSSSEIIKATRASLIERECSHSSDKADKTYLPHQIKETLDLKEISIGPILADPSSTNTDFHRSLAQDDEPLLKQKSYCNVT